MKIESATFGADQLHAFWEELRERDRLALVERLRSAAGRLRALGGRSPRPGGGDPDQWSAHEILAHIAVLTKFYGVLAYRTGSGAMKELDLLGSVHLRDVAGQEMAKLPAGDLLAAALESIERTIAYLEATGAADLERRADVGGGRAISALEFARLPLCSHLELHLVQLEAVLD